LGAGPPDEKISAMGEEKLRRILKEAGLWWRACDGNGQTGMKKKEGRAAIKNALAVLKLLGQVKGGGSKFTLGKGKKMERLLWLEGESHRKGGKKRKGGASLKIREDVKHPTARQEVGSPSRQ